MAGYRLEDFSGAVGETWVLTEGEASLDLVLECAEELPRAIREEGSFRLEFRGPQSPIAPQAIYRFSHGGRDFEIFIVPVSSDESGTVYEAVFN